MGLEGDLGTHNDRVEVIHSACGHALPRCIEEIEIGLMKPVAEVKLHLGSLDLLDHARAPDLSGVAADANRCAARIELRNQGRIRTCTDIILEPTVLAVKARRP